MPTGLGGTPPYLDFSAESVDDAFVAEESKLTEYLVPHRSEFAPAYSCCRWPAHIEAYRGVMREVQKNPSPFAYLNPPQLIKHALGLGLLTRNIDVTLLYIFWEPGNADSYREFERHRREIERFDQAVRESSIKFFFKSYRELLQEWLRQDSAWLQSHASELTMRYAVDV